MQRLSHHHHLLMLLLLVREDEEGKLLFSALPSANGSTVPV